MKKLIYCALALATGLFAASCQQENLEPVAQGNTVTFEVSIPEVATKGLGDNVSNINDLVYAVYYTTASSLEAIQNGSAGYELLYQKNYATDVNPFNGGNTAIIPIELVNDKNYFVIFWAQNEDRWVGESFDLRRVAYPAEGMNANDNDYAAFSGISFITSDNLSAKKSVILKRPFAQINIGTQLATEFTITPTTSSVTVNKAGTSFNLIKQVAEGEGSVTFNTANVPTNPDRTDGKLVVNNTEYTYAAMNYVFANGNVDVEYTINTAAHGAVSNTVANVPVAANYRTNIVGRLLTSTADYTVVLDEFDTNNNSGDIEVITEGLVKNQNGDYEISTNNGLIHAINNLWVDKHGVANPKTFYVYPQEYNITDDQIKDVVVTSGTLKVIKDKPVMTRSIVIEGIVIKGLSKPLIKSVGEDATVVISGVTIVNYEGSAESGALVGENDGKVVIDDCAILDEEGNADETTELIGDKDENGTVAEPEYEIEGNSCVVYDAVQLAAAFAAEEVEAIVLGADIALEDVLVFPEGRTATLDLKGYVLTIAGNEEKVSSTYAINNHGTLTIKDSYGVGAVNARGIYNGYVAGGDPIATAKLTIESGTFNAKGTNGGAAVFNYGVAEIKGGKFTSIGGYSLNNQGGASMTISEGVKANNGIYNSGATLTINGGEIEGNRSGCHVVYSLNSTVTIKGGTIHNNNSGNSTLMAAGTSEMTVTGGTFSIKDGRVEGNGNTWTSCLTDTQHTATLTVTGGTFNGGFRVQGGTTMNISGGTFNDVGGSGYNVYTGATIEITGGSYNIDVNKWCHKDYKAVKNAETTMWDVVAKVYVAEVVGGEKYETLQEAVNAAQDGATIELLSNETFSETNRYNNGGWWDGLGYSGDKSFTIDLKGKTITQNGALNDYLMWFKNDGDKGNTITLKNGTMDAGTTAYCALATASSNAQKITINLESINLINNNSNGATIKFRGGAELNVKAGTVITGNNSYTGIEAVGNTTIVNIYEGAKIYQNGTSSSWGWLVGASVNATVNVYGGEGKSARGAFGAMTSGGTINISGGEWIANNDGTVANDNRGVLIAQSDKQYNSGAGNAVVNVTGGTFKGGYNCYGNAVGDAQINIKGGNFNANPSSYVENGYRAAEDNGIWNVTDAQVYTEAALKTALKAGGEIILGSDITLTEDWTPVGTNEAPFTGIFDGKGHKISGLKIAETKQAAFIAYTGENTIIKNVIFDEVDINSTGYAGGVVCSANNAGLVLSNIEVHGTIYGKSYAGGIIMDAANITIENCVNYADISSSYAAGGIAAWIEGSETKVSNVVNYGKITAATTAAGISNRFAGVITNATNHGEITGTGDMPAAGVVAVQLSDSKYSYCYNRGIVKSTADNPNASASGILGHTSTAAELNYCANFGTITAEQSYAGGIAYSLYGSINASYCYNAGAIAGADGAGAIAPKAQYGTGDKASYCLNAGNIISSNGTVYQGSNQNVSSYYYDGTTLRNVADNAEIAEADALAVLNGGTDKDFFSIENDKITVK